MLPIRGRRLQHAKLNERRDVAEADQRSVTAERAAPHDFLEQALGRQKR
jgi:hypothetical protein